MIIKNYAFTAFAFMAICNTAIAMDAPPTNLYETLGKMLEKNRTTNTDNHYDALSDQMEILPHYRLEGHTGQVLGVTAFSVDTQTFAVSVSHDATIKIWDMKDRRCIVTLDNKGVPVCAVAMVTDAENQKFIASGDNRGIVQLWELDGPYGEGLEGHTKSISAIEPLFMGNLFASGSYDGTIRIWNPSSRECRHVLSADIAVIRLSALPNGLLAASYLDSTIRIWNPLTGKCLQEWSANLGNNTFPGVWGLCFTNEDVLISAQDSPEVGPNICDIWNCNTKQSLHKFYAAHQGCVFSINNYDDSRVMISCGTYFSMYNYITKQFEWTKLAGIADGGAFITAAVHDGIIIYAGMFFDETYCKYVYVSDPTQPTVNATYSKRCTLF